MSCRLVFLGRVEILAILLIDLGEEIVEFRGIFLVEQAVDELSCFAEVSGEVIGLRQIVSRCRRRRDGGAAPPRGESQPR